MRGESCLTSTAEALAAYLGGLKVSQGPLAGRRLEVLPWEREALALLDTPGPVAVSMARANGKTTFVAGLLAACLDGPLREPRADVLLASPSLRQSRIAFAHVREFLAARHDLRDRAVWRVNDTHLHAQITHRPTGARVLCVGCTPDTLHGLAVGFALIDEPAKLPPAKRDALLAAVRTSAGKIEGARVVAIGTRSDAPAHWFTKMLAGPRALVYAAEARDDPFAVETWRRANPSLDAFPALLPAIREEAREAERDPALLPAFKALRLNLGTAETEAASLIDVDAFEAVEVDRVDRGGPYVLGVDLGSGAAMSAAAACWYGSGAVEAFAMFPAEPPLAERGRADAVGSLYVEMAAGGDLLTSGVHVVNVADVLREALARWGRPEAIVCDRWREAELREALAAVGFPLARLAVRGQGFKDGGEDVRRFRRQVLARTVRVRRSLLIVGALAEARVVTDPAGNAKLAKSSEGGRRQAARDDVAAAIVLAVAERDREGREEPEPARGPRVHIPAAVRARM